MEQLFLKVPEYHFPPQFCSSVIRLNLSMGSSTPSLSVVPMGPSATRFSFDLYFLNQEFTRRRRMCTFDLLAAHLKWTGCIVRKTLAFEKHCKEIKYMGGLWAVQERRAALDKPKSVFVCSSGLPVSKQPFVASQLAVVCSWYLTFSVWLLCIC